MFGEIASGGMATVHLGCVLRGPERGRPIAIKQLRSHYLRDREFLTMFLDEARIVTRIRHPNVVATSEVVQSGDGMFLMMEYVHGESLAKLLRIMRTKRAQTPPAIAARVVHDVLLGLHGAHETRGEDGGMLDVVHRDVSPQNVMVGVDGLARVLDFGVAKAAGRAQVTREGQIKGKLAYMAPEQVRGQVDRRTDVFAAAVVLWETLTARRLHEGMKDYDMVARVVQGKLSRPSMYAPDVSPELDAIVMKGLAAHPDKRHATAAELARDLVQRVPLASAEEVASWCEALAEDALTERAEVVARMARDLDVLAPAPGSPAPLPAPPVPISAPDDDADDDEPTRPARLLDRPLVALAVPTPLAPIEIDGGSEPPPPLAPAAAEGKTEMQPAETPPPVPDPEQAPRSVPRAAIRRKYLVALLLSVIVASAGATVGIRALLVARHPAPRSVPSAAPPPAR
jgi:serine/threonine-protein kinase